MNLLAQVWQALARGEPVTVAAAALVLLAVVGAWRAAADSPWARLATLPTLALLALAALGLTTLVASSRPLRVRAVATGPAPPASPATSAVVATSGDPGELALALAARDVDRVSLVWTAPVAGAAAPAHRPGVPTASAVEPLGFEPGALALRAGRALRVGRPAELELTMPVEAQGIVRLTAGGEVVELPFATPAGIASLKFTPTHAGALALELQARVGAREVHASGELQVTTPRPVVVVGRAAEVLAAALRVQAVQVETAAQLPAALDAVDALVLLDPLDAAAQARVQAFVDAGGGVLFVGGADGGALPLRDESWAPLSPVLLAARPQPTPVPDQPGAERAEPSPPSPPTLPPNQTPSEPDRPVTGDTSTAGPTGGEEREVERRHVAMVFVIDRSTSMSEPAYDGGPARMDYVRSAAQATASRLLPADRLAIITFGNPGTEQVVLPLTPAEPLEPVHRAFAQLASRPNEGTYVESAVVRAVALLGKDQAAVKHLVVISDGEIVDLIAACSRVRDARAQGVTTSMIRFGPLDTSRTSALCRKFVELGGGQYLHSTDTREVPALVSAEVKRVLGETGRRVSDDAAPAQPKVADAAPPPTPPRPEPTPPRPEPTTPPPPVPIALQVRALAASPLLAPIPSVAPPSLAGVLPVTARPEARVLLIAGQEGRPLLAFKNYGLGRTAAWSADLTGSWSSEWQRAPSFPAWLGQWVSAVLPAEPQVQAADLLRARSVAPLGPTPAMLAALTRWSGAELQAWPPAAAAEVVALREPQLLGAWFAAWGALGMLFVLGLEFLWGRRRAA